MQSPLLGSHALPTEVALGGRAFPIRHDFRDGVRFETLMFDERLPDEAKLPAALRIWYETMPPAAMLSEAIDAMLDFYRCGKVPTPDVGGDTAPLYSYVHDYDLIYAAFLQSYGIDLLDPETRLHWWRFRAMLAALPADCQLMRVIGYRAAKPYDGMSKEQRHHMAKMKRLFAIPREDGMAAKRIRTEADHDAALAAVLAAKRGEGL